jgi:ribosomal protein S18 acetylase RimI-like enzyme
LLIQSYEDTDEGEVVALWRACGLLVPHNDPVEDIAFCRQSGHGEVFVGREGDRLAAALMAGHDGHRAWLYYLAVDPGRRHAGLAREITGHAERWLAGLGVRKVQLMIRDTNAVVREFYAAIGYMEEPRMVMARWLVDRYAATRRDDG